MARDVILNFIFPAMSAAGVLGLAVWVFKKWISTRIQHEYDRKLATHKAQLKTEQEFAILNIKTALAREEAFHAVAHASFAAGQKASMERKLSAIDRLWSCILQLRASLPPVLNFMDFMTVDEYTKDKDHPDFQKLTGDLSPEKLATLVSKSMEEVRPYVGEYMWAVFFSYQAILIRILFLLHLGGTDAEKIEWHKDTRTRQLIEAVLTVPAELQQFDQTQFGKLSWLQQRLESKIVGAAQKVIAGETFGVESLEQAMLIHQRIAQLSPPEERKQWESS